MFWETTPSPALIAFAKAASDSTWLENALGGIARTCERCLRHKKRFGLYWPLQSSPASRHRHQDRSDPEACHPKLAHSRFPIAPRPALAHQAQRMNYRHAFHAGNHADCLKHALLLALLGALRRKPTPFAVLDTHAGCGLYDLAAPETARSKEAARGALRLVKNTAPALAPFMAAVREAGFPAFYPGSPALIRAGLRPQDRLVAVELHPEDHAKLKAYFNRDPQVAVHQRDAWEALRALTPFPEKRGLVLIDPPFEMEGDYGRITDAMALLRHRFRAAIIAAWYPVKHRAPVRGFHHGLIEAGIAPLLAAELWLREPTDPQRLNGSGLLVANPPQGFAEDAAEILPALLACLGADEAGAGSAVTWLAP